MAEIARATLKKHTTHGKNHETRRPTRRTTGNLHKVLPRVRESIHRPDARALLQRGVSGEVLETAEGETEMNDSHLDPPDEPEGYLCIECREGYGDVESVEYGIIHMRCDNCGARFDVMPPHDPEPPDFDNDIFDQPDPPEKCPHGEEWAECNACMIAGDLAFDSARERR